MPNEFGEWARRTSTNAQRALNRFNRRHPWSHNDHFHRWILRRLPAAVDSALDVGCGRGSLMRRLAARVGRAEGLDVDQEMIAATKAATADLPNVSVRQASFLDVEGDYDVITMVSSLHHMDPAAALAHAAKLLRPGGRLLVIGHALADGPVDRVWELASVILNPLVGFVKQPRPMADGDAEAAGSFPVREPKLTFAETAALAREVLPGIRVRRRLFFRHTLEWTKPLLPGRDVSPVPPGRTDR